MARNLPKDASRADGSGGGDGRPDMDPGREEHAFKDELNLAEFPIAALTDRVPDGQTTLVFEDRLDPREGPRG